MEIGSYSIGYQNGHKDAEDKYKPKEADLEKKEVIRTLNKLANDYLVYPNETKALDYAIRELEKPSITNDILDKIRAEINSPNRGTCDYFIVDRIEEIINKYKSESKEGAEE